MHFSELEIQVIRSHIVAGINDLTKSLEVLPDAFTKQIVQDAINIRKDILLEIDSRA